MALSMSPDADMQQVIAQAQQQVALACHSGRQILTALASGDEPAAMARKVAKAAQAAEAAMAAAQVRIVSLGPLMPGPGQVEDPLTGAARKAVLDRRKAEPARGNGAASSEAMSLGKYAGAGPQVLQALTQRITAATGLHVQLRTRSGPGAQPEEATEVRLVVAGILSAAVALAAAGQPEAVRVSLMSAEEHAAGSLDAWQASQHQVFRRVSELAMQALAHFTERAQQAAAEADQREREQAGADADCHQAEKASACSSSHQSACACALEDLLLWLSAYRTLFSQPCAATGKLLALDPVSNVLLPPIVRPVKHVTRRQLLAVARNPSECPAYMPHAAPPGC